MKKIGFIGAFDKTDMLIQIAKIITLVGKKVVVIDSTINQKAKYIVPVINPTRTYVTEYENFDVAVGFENLNEIKNYLGLGENEELEYDIALIDIDSFNVYEAFNMKEAYTNYFVTSFDLFSLKKGLEILSGINYEISLKKVLFTKTMSSEENEYLDFLSMRYPIKWVEDKIYFPFELGDQSAIIESQRVSKIKLRSLSSQYKDSLIEISGEILADYSTNDLRRIVKTIEKSE